MIHTCTLWDCELSRVYHLGLCAALSYTEVAGPHSRARGPGGLKACILTNSWPIGLQFAFNRIAGGIMSLTSTVSSSSVASNVTSTVMSTALYARHHEDPSADHGYLFAILYSVLGVAGLLALVLLVRCANRLPRTNKQQTHDVNELNNRYEMQPVDRKGVEGFNDAIAKEESGPSYTMAVSQTKNKMAENSQNCEDSDYATVTSNESQYGVDSTICEISDPNYDNQSQDTHASKSNGVIATKAEKRLLVKQAMADNAQVSSTSPSGWSEEHNVLYDDNHLATHDDIDIVADPTQRSEYLTTCDSDSNGKIVYVPMVGLGLDRRRSSIDDVYQVPIPKNRRKRSLETDYDFENHPAEIACDLDDRIDDGYSRIRSTYDSDGSDDSADPIVDCISIANIEKSFHKLSNQDKNLVAYSKINDEYSVLNQNPQDNASASVS